MEEELQQLRELVVQLRAENEQLSRVGSAPQLGSSGAGPVPIASGDIPTSGGKVSERLIAC